MLPRGLFVFGKSVGKENGKKSGKDVDILFFFMILVPPEEKI